MRLEARTVAPPSLGHVKMEDRKRPSGHDNPAPPAKRQAVTVNGARSHPDADMPWKDDIEVRPPIRPNTLPRQPEHTLIPH
ncbi:E3 ubiquitin-protein ligase bre1 [Didymella glomerata]|jgi:E3 ubiquitin-protein ligase BRE1|uniref:E3 ubiquitin-protein ligase bre1 n=1 Tax=Didymella glomerata TaxID=749621 RepID=A0A9W8X120_9PLEO|nr:E3 ubiquitin-protein ligase bre1 [Didymella glomerata]